MSRKGHFGRGTDQIANLFRLSLFFNGSSTTAADLLDDCLKEQGKKAADADCRVLLAEQFESEGNNSLAVAEWSQAVKLRNTPALHAKLASALVAANRDREALAELRKLVRLDWPENSKAERSACHLLLSEIFLRYSHEFRDSGGEATGVVLLENAAMDARRALVINPIDARANKQFLLIAQEATALCPNEIDNHMWLGAAYLLKGDFRRADSEYAECASLEPSDPRLGVAKTIYQVIRSNPSRSSKGMVAESIAKVNDLLTDDPDNVQLWNFLGRLHEQNADAKEASECFAKAKKLYWSASK
jgi:Flp pilus assembly protein TadD